MAFRGIRLPLKATAGPNPSYPPPCCYNAHSPVRASNPQVVKHHGGLKVRCVYQFRQPGKMVEREGVQP